ncbi:hypothetical protein FRC09_016334 [Ceratobasidium sp. 395]|nr:hypothetical protein FRC09_016334 [Ceratobasidium sp. 395]
MPHLSLFKTLPDEWRTWGKNRFDEVEQDWMCEHFYDKFIATAGCCKAPITELSGLTPGKSADQTSATTTINQADALRDKMFVAFQEEFPWRSPHAPVPTEDFDKMLRSALMFNELEWSLRPTWLYNWLQKEKQRRADVAAGKTKEAQKPKNTRKTRQPTSARKKPEAPLPTAGVYDVSQEDLAEEEKTFMYLMEQTRTPWSARRLIEDLNNVAPAVSRATEAEMVLYAVWQRKGKLKSTEVSSPRAQYFLGLDEDVSALQAFTTHIVQLTGPHLSTDTESPAATIYGDPARDWMPIWPNGDFSLIQKQRLLDLWYQCFWLWSGGRYKVPYQLITMDAESGTYVMSKVQRYPEGISVLVHPFSMSEQDVDAWPRPGKYDSYTRQHISDDSVLLYPLESQAYTNYRGSQEAPARIAQAQRSDDLLVVMADSPRISIAPGRVKELKSVNQKRNVFTQLLDELLVHDNAGPSEVHIQISACTVSYMVCGKLSEVVYEEMTRAMPLLTGVVPSAADDVNLLAQELGGFISPKFYRENAPEDRAFRVFSLLKWCELDEWVHKPSSTFASGCYGVKWPVLVLYFLHLNQQMIETPGMTLPESYIGVEPTMSRQEWDEVAIAAENLLIALKKSTATLESTLEERVIRNSSPSNTLLRYFSLDDLDKVRVKLAATDDDKWEMQGLTQAERPEVVVYWGSVKRGAESGVSPPKTKKTRKTGAPGAGDLDELEEDPQSSKRRRSARFSLPKSRESESAQSSQGPSSEDEYEALDFKDKAEDELMDDEEQDELGNSSKEMPEEAPKKAPEEAPKPSAGPSKKSSMKPRPKGKVEISVELTERPGQSSKDLMGPHWSERQQK